ncbi:MAG: endonuclease MutS2 [Cellulosilyticaceae bacterium]
MNERALYKLEFHKIKDMLKNHAVTEVGKNKIETLVPSADFEEVVKWQKETTDALNMVVKKGKVPIGSVKEIHTSLKRVEIGAVLSSHELLNIAKVLETCRRLRSYYKEDAETTSYPYLQTYFESLSVHGDIEHEIRRCIVAPDEFADDATPELSTIRKQMKTTNNKIRETLQSIIHSSQYQDILQDPVITMRQDRYCIPVKVEYKNTFKGIVHDQSSTGATAFIEPMAVVELGNALRAMVAKEQEEIEKILASLTELVATIAPMLGSSFGIMTTLDVIFAKAEFALKIDGREPKLNHKGYIHLKRARHPMLPKEHVVPIDVYVGDAFTTLLITGPNTGGKTVTLKTLGLFTLMAQAGMQIPAGEGSSVAVFDDVFADLGDEQSIEQSLSTFSSHMTNIVNILDKMTTNSLVLMDEVGSGTDPIEGAALAMSILEHLRKQQIRTVATTHYSELKLYAVSTDGVENASCEFDVESLRPTYKLLIGVPGKSNAFAISMKLGLSEYLIEDAKVFLQKENVKMEDILVELEYSKRMAEIEKEKAESYRKEAERFKEEIKKERQKLEKSKQKIMERANEKAQEVLKQVEQEADAVLKEVRQAARAAKVVIDEKGLHQAKGNMSQKLGKQQQIVGKTLGPKKTFKKVLKNIEAGEKVMVTNLMQQGVVLTPPDASGNAMVQIGILPVKVHITHLQRTQEEEVAAPKTKKRPVSSGGVSHKISKTANIRTDVDVRGLMVDEALPVVDKYLDDAYLAGLKQATIIHGKGTGALRAAISQMLKRHPHIATFRPGTYGEGEMGVTVVEIK